VILLAVGGVVGALVVAGVVGALTRSNNDTTVSVPSLSLTFPSFAATASAPAPQAAAASGHVGSAIPLAGQASGEKVDVTLLKVAATTTATDGFSSPSAGDRYFAAQFRLANTGSLAYTDAADNDAVAFDAQGKQYQAAIVASIAAGPLFGDQLDIAPGASASGWIVFEVPAATTITSVQFTTDSGFGAAGRWSVP
jgi:hypothetical protein